MWRSLSSWRTLGAGLEYLEWMRVAPTSAFEDTDLNWLIQIVSFESRVLVYQTGSICVYICVCVYICTLWISTFISVCIRDKPPSLMSCIGTEMEMKANRKWSICFEWYCQDFKNPWISEVSSYCSFSGKCFENAQGSTENPFQSWQLLSALRWLGIQWVNSDDMLCPECSYSVTGQISKTIDNGEKNLSQREYYTAWESMGTLTMF